MDRTEIKELLNAQNFRLTHERELLLNLFASASSMLTPGQLFEQAKSQQLKIGLTTVYRLLEVLTKVRVATPFLVDGNIYYTFCGLEHHHHFVCLGCHHVVEVKGSCPTFDVPSEYHVTEHRADLFGVCPECNGSQALEAKQ